MNGRRLFSLAFVLGPLVALSSTAHAEGKHSARPAAAESDDDTPAGPQRDPDNVTAVSEFMATCVEGSHKFLARDFTGAIKSFRAAIQLNPKNPLGHYDLGEAELAAGNIDEAEAAWRQAELVADSRHPDIRAHVLFVLADVLERQKKWPDAKAAWQAYLEWVGKYPDAGVFAGSGTSRIQAIDAAAKLDKSYEIVRKRIAESAHGNVFTEIAPKP